MARRCLALTCAVLPALGVFLALAHSSHAQSYARLVWDQLDGIYDTVSEDGYSTKNYIMGTLDEGDSELWTLEFDGGYTYTVRGVCDGDCEDIDLKITQNGREIGSDTLADDFPIVTFDVARDADYTIEVEMYDCSIEPCYFGIGIFYR